MTNTEPWYSGDVAVRTEKYFIVSPYLIIDCDDSRDSRDLVGKYGDGGMEVGWRWEDWSGW